MSQHLDVHKLGLFIVIGLGLVFSWVAGNYVAEENYLPIAGVLGSLFVLTVIFGLGKSIYLLIPVCWGLNGKITVLPLPFDVRQLVLIAASGLFIADLIFKRRLQSRTFSMIDFWVVVNLLYLASVFFRNPVGVAAIGGGERVGGRPYLDVILGVFAYLILSRERVGVRYAMRLPKMILAVAGFGAFAGGVGMFLPGIGAKLSMFYSGFGPSGSVIGDEGSVLGDVSIGEDRLIFLSYFGTSVCLYVVSMLNPFLLFSFHHLKSLLCYISGIVMVMLSGFRDALILVILMTGISVYLREKTTGFLKMVFVGGFILTITLAASYGGVHIPFTFQRTLSFLPGKWDENAVLSAKDSSEWRFKMWETVLTSDRYIRNKIFGDGFGLLRADFEIQASAIKGGGLAYGGDMAAQEAFMINGDFHSGPVSSIRFVGLVGLLLFLSLMFMTSRSAYLLIRKTWGTPFQTCALFIGIPLIFQPIFFLFVFGDYRQELVNQLYSVGVLKMLDVSFVNLALKASGVELRLRHTGRFTEQTVTS